MKRFSKENERAEAPEGLIDPLVTVEPGDVINPSVMLAQLFPFIHLFLKKRERKTSANILTEE